MKTSTVTVAMDGLDVHAIAMSVQTANRFSSEIHLTDGDRRLNAKSLMGMMALGLAMGDQVTIEAVGEDEDRAVLAMEEYLTRHREKE